MKVPQALLLQLLAGWYNGGFFLFHLKPKEIMNESLVTPVNDDGTLNVIIEIPKGSRNKYEIDKKTGFVLLDRVLFSSVHYPCDYGYVPNTLCEDGDPLDVLVVGDDPLFPGVLVEARPLGVLGMIDGGDSDAKIIAVPTANPRYKHINDISQLPPHLLEEIEEFFRSYKNLEKKEVETTGWQGKEAAQKEIDLSLELFSKK